jgi:DNA integrity scanning protein DisA with diadenylate cyclase activity
VLEGFLHLFARRSVMAVLTDVADILLVTYIVYRTLLVLRGTRAMQMGIGLGVLSVVYFVSKWADFVTLLYLLNALPIILIVVVVFQNDIRRGLMRVGARAFFAGLSRQQESKAIDEVVAAATELARHRIGALIAFEQDANLDEFVIGQGTALDAAVQRELLVSLFIPSSSVTSGWRKPGSFSRCPTRRSWTNRWARGTGPPSASRRRPMPWSSSSARSAGTSASASTATS